MSAFLTELQVENATDQDDGKWRLTAPLVYQSDVANLTITVPAEFVTDLASTPRIPFVYEFAGGVANMASVVHDYAYSTHIVDRKTADAILREASAVTGVSWLKRQAMYIGVRAFGWSHWGNGPATV